MNWDDLLDFFKQEDERLNTHYCLEHDKMILTRTLKIAEEVGELSEQVLIHAGVARKEKLEKKSQEHV